MAYFWCTDHRAVEGEHGCRAEVRMGPYANQDAAEHALQTSHERTAKQDAEDEAWREGN